QFDCFSDRSRIAAKAAVPQTIANHRNVPSARTVLFWGVRPAEYNRRPKHLKISRRRVNSFHLLGTIPACKIHARTRKVVCRDGLKYLCLLAPNRELGNRCGEAVP